MATAICILSGVLLLLLGVCVFLATSLYLTTEELKYRARKGLQIPEPVRWDYTRETGWVDAEVEDVEIEL